MLTLRQVHEAVQAERERLGLPPIEQTKKTFARNSEGKACSPMNFERIHSCCEAGLLGAAFYKGLISEDNHYEITCRLQKEVVENTVYTGFTTANDAGWTFEDFCRFADERGF